MARSNVKECGDIDFSGDILPAMEKLCMNAEHSDVRFIFENTKIPAHKAILSARSSYFQSLFRGGFVESNQTEIELNVPLDAFKVILRFIYTGYLSLTPLNVNQIIDVYALVDLYNFESLIETILKYLAAILSMDNCFEILNAAYLYSWNDLGNACLSLMDRHSTELIKQDHFKSISPTLLCTLLERDTFYAPEIDIFDAVKNWAISNPSADLIVTCFSKHVSEFFRTPFSLIRWSLISMNDLDNIVSPSNVLDELIDVAKRNRAYQTSRIPNPLPEYSGENLASQKYNAKTICGESASALLNGSFTVYNLVEGFTYHPITTSPAYKYHSIIVKLGDVYIINYIEMLLVDKDERSFSYYIDVSVDGITYVRLIDYTAYCCRSWQFLHFPPRAVQFIKLVGTRAISVAQNSMLPMTHSDGTRYFSSLPTFGVVGLKAMLIESGGTVDDFQRPTNNVADPYIGAKVIEGVGDNNMLNKFINKFTCHEKNEGRIILQLNQPYYISSMRMLLGCDRNSSNRYSFYIETSLDNANWQMAVDKRDENLKRMQKFEFEERLVVFVKIIGTQTDIDFSCIYFECPNTKRKR